MERRVFFIKSVFSSSPFGVELVGCVDEIPYFASVEGAVEFLEVRSPAWSL